jgi:hypothetical protein
LTGVKSGEGEESECLRLTMRAPKYRAAAMYGKRLGES